MQPVTAPPRQVVEIYEGPPLPEGPAPAERAGGLGALLRELEQLSGLAHPHLVRVAGWGSDGPGGGGGRACLLTELCACGTVADALARFTPMDGGRAHVNAARRCLPTPLPPPPAPRLMDPRHPPVHTGGKSAPLYPSIHDNIPGMFRAVERSVRLPGRWLHGCLRHEPSTPPPPWSMAPGMPAP